MMSREFQRATPVRKSVSAVTTSSGGGATLSTGTLVTCDTRSTSSPSARPITSTTTMRDDGVTTAGVRPRPGADLHHREDPAAEVGDAPDVGRHLRHPGDPVHPDHLPHLGHRNAELLAIQGEGQEMQHRGRGSRIGRRRRQRIREAQQRLGDRADVS